MCLQWLFGESIPTAPVTKSTGDDVEKQDGASSASTTSSNSGHGRSHSVGGAAQPAGRQPPETFDIMSEHPMSMTASAAAVISTEDLRQMQGQCPACGVQLFDLRKDRAGKITKIPLTRSGVSARGQCIACTRDISGNGGCAKVASITDEDEDLMKKASDDDARKHAARSKPATKPGATHAGGKGKSVRNLCDGEEDFDDEAQGLCTTTANMSTSSQLQPVHTAVYSGTYNEYGERHGFGEMVWNNGDSYRGEFFNGVRHGQGTLTFNEGGEYVGDWECNQMHGNGTRRFKDGNVFMGTFVKGKRTGEGRFYYANGDLYHGEWVEGYMEGTGRYYYSSGQRFEGTFVKGKRHGKGKLQRTDGTLEIHRYVNDVRMGSGVRWSADRTQAWRLETKNGKLVRKVKIPIPEAVSMDYAMDYDVHLMNQHPDHQVRQRAQQPGAVHAGGVAPVMVPAGRGGGESGLIRQLSGRAFSSSVAGQANDYY